MVLHHIGLNIKLNIFDAKEITLKYCLFNFNVSLNLKIFQVVDFIFP